MLAYPDGRNANLQTPSPSPRHGASLPPDEHLVCYDYLYYVSAHKVGNASYVGILIHISIQPFEFEYDFSPAWRYVAQYMRWTQPLEELADEYLRATIGVKASEPTPPVSSHQRVLSTHAEN
jgi:hypothetical protein